MKLFKNKLDPIFVTKKTHEYKHVSAELFYEVFSHPITLKCALRYLHEKRIEKRKLYNIPRGIVLMIN